MNATIATPKTTWCCLCRLLACLPLLLSITSPARTQTIRVDAAPDHAVNSFRPTEALGAGLDRISRASTDKIFTEPILKQMLSAGWQTVTYRQNTELHVEAWHWNPEGTWSDGDKGYFVGNSALGVPIRHSFGYPLPHAGFSQPDGASYSRLTDGDTNTYWKSNPYLTKTFTGQNDSLHPQWVVIDLAAIQQINAIRIAWADPYARKYLVQYFTGRDPLRHAAQGSWVTFPGGEITNGTGGSGSATLTLSQLPVATQFLRIWMTESSNTCDTHGSADKRNCVGYAIRELYAGTLNDSGFHDVVHHTADRAQSNTICSSVDPWHTASVVNDRADQVGFDLFYTSGITRGLPAMIPIAMLYDTPENAAAEIAYIEKRGYPISYVEMGEEPDGKYCLPEDYAELYLQFATALHRVDPKLKLGGPIFEGVNEDIQVSPDAQGKVSWMGRFFDYLKSHQRLADLSFVSFEHYPLQNCQIKWSDLYDEAKLVSHILQVWRDDGLPPSVPMFITESNIASGADESFVDVFAALWWADYIGAFLEAGGKAVYYFHYAPEEMSRSCGGTSPGTFSMFTITPDYQIKQPDSQFFAAQLINLEWVQPGSGAHQLFSAASDIQDLVGNNLVTAYAVLRPDKQWSLMIINKDQENPHSVQIAFDAAGAKQTHFHGPVSMVTFGSEQYQWHSNIDGGTADPDGPAARSTITGNANTRYILPKASVTVLAGKLGD